MIFLRKPEFIASDLRDRLKRSSVNASQHRPSHAKAATPGRPEAAAIPLA
jgi:hypothetical protein